MDYPETLAKPTWEYGQDMTDYQRRTPFDCGWTRQRKQWPQFGSSVELSFIMSTADFNDWAVWVDANGYDWFNIVLDNAVTYEVRMVSDIQYTYNNFDRVIVRVTGEIKGA